MIEAINIETEEQFDWMVREMRGLNKSNKPSQNKKEDNGKTK